MLGKIICKAQSEKAVEYIWSFIKWRSEKRGGFDVAMAGAFLYLLQKGALYVKDNVDFDKDNVITHLDGNYLYMIKADYPVDTIGLCMDLPKDDPMFDIVERNIHKLNQSGFNKSFTEKLEGYFDGVWTMGTILSWCLEDSEDYSYFYDNRPEEFSQLAALLVDVKGKTVLNPFPEDLSLSSALEGYSSFEGCTMSRTDMRLWDYQVLRLAIEGEDTSKISLTHMEVDGEFRHRYDATVSFPPFNYWLHSKSGEKWDTSSILLRRFDEYSTPNGILFTIVPLNIIYGSDYGMSSVRKDILDRNYLDAVIRLPERLIQRTNIAIAAIILRKGRRDGDKVRMVDASQMIIPHWGRNKLDVNAVVEAYYNGGAKSVLVDPREIAEKSYLFEPGLYCREETKVRDGFELKAVGDILKPARTTSSFRNPFGSVIKVGSLTSDFYDYDIDIEELSESDNLKSAKKLTSPAILISNVGNKIKAGYCKASEVNPVFLINVSAYTISDENVDMGYLFMQLSKAEIPVFGTIPRITSQVLNTTKLEFPILDQPGSLELQKKLFEEGKAAAQLAKARELGLQDVIDRMKAEYMNEIRSRKHDMMPHLRQISSARKNLDYYLSHKENFAEKDLIAGMREEIGNQKVAIDALTMLLQIFSREDRFGTPEVINIDKFFTENFTDGVNYINDHDTDYLSLQEGGYSIPEEIINPRWDPEQGIQSLMEGPSYAEGINIFMAKDDLQRLCDNIIGNAVKHGFTDPERTDYSIVTELSLNIKRDMFQIDFCNNGNPLPKGLTKELYGARGEKAGETGGTGEGGYIVKSIVEHYGGDFDIFCEPSGEEFLTTIRIYLPIYRDNE